MNFLFSVLLYYINRLFITLFYFVFGNSQRQKLQRQHPRRPYLRPNKNEQDRRQENALPFNELARSANRPIYHNPDNSIRGTLMDNNRQRNEINRQLFELKLNRHQAGGIRKRIQFNGTDNSRRPKISTIKTTTTQATTTQPIIATLGLTDEQLFQKQGEHQASDQARKHQSELQHRHDQLELERKQMLENERVREEKRRQNELNNLKNEDNRRILQETQQQREIKTNEIDRRTETSLKLKKEKLNRIRDKLKHMTPEQQEEFYTQREERKKRKNGKRDVEQQKTT